MLAPVTVEDLVEEWQQNQDKLLAFMLEKIWRAGMKPDDSLCWLAEDGIIKISTHEKWKEESITKVFGEIQTRSETTGMAYHKTFDAAFKAAEKDKTIWKISWGDGDNRIRMVRDRNAWKYEPIELPDDKKGRK